MLLTDKDFWNDDGIGVPGVAPAGDSLFFASPKKSKQKKGDPAVCVPSLRCGQPAVLSPAGVTCKLAALKQARALIRLAFRSSAHTEGAFAVGVGFGAAVTPALYAYERQRKAPNARQSQ